MLYHKLYTYLDMSISDGVSRPGFLQSPSLSHFFSADGDQISLTHASMARYPKILETTPAGQAFVTTHTTLRDAVPDQTSGDSLLGVPADAVVGVRKSQQAISRLLWDIRAKVSRQFYHEADLENPEAAAYFARLGSVSASAIFRSWPGQIRGTERMAPAMFHTIMQLSFGQPISTVAKDVGKTLRTGGGDSTMDARARSLVGAKMRGNSDTKRHDRVKNAIASLCRAYRVPVHVEHEAAFADVVWLSQAETDHRGRARMTPDLIIHVAGLAKPILGEVKTLGDVPTWSKRQALSRGAVGYATNRRQQGVVSGYRHLATKTDKIQGHRDPSLPTGTETPAGWYEQSDNYGPVRRKLESYQIRGLVCGPRGEFSPDLDRLLSDIAGQGEVNMAGQIQRSGAGTVQQLLLFHARCQLGITSQMATAEHLLGRYDEMQLRMRWRRSDDSATRVVFGDGGPSEIVADRRQITYGAEGAIPQGQDLWRSSDH